MTAAVFCWVVKKCCTFKCFTFSAVFFRSNFSSLDTLVTQFFVTIISCILFAKMIASWDGIFKGFAIRRVFCVLSKGNYCFGLFRNIQLC